MPIYLFFIAEGKYPKFQLTDPAICTKSKKKNRFGKTDIGLKGIRKFCQSHVCNGVCRGLGLPPVGRKRKEEHSNSSPSPDQGAMFGGYVATGDADVSRTGGRWVPP